MDTLAILCSCQPFGVLKPRSLEQRLIEITTRTTSTLGNLRLSMGRGIEHMQYAWFKAKVKVVVDADAVHTCNAASINRTNRSPRQYI